MKTIDKNSVQQVAENLMRQHVFTTTLEVKQALRADRYFAKQADVSMFMDQLATELDWDYFENGEYRTYSTKQNVDQDILKLLFSNN
jgi:hypothetical protein